MDRKLLFLGTGSSGGVPIIGCRCAVCQSTSPYNKRLRPSVLIRLGEKNILVDPGPDFRQQALRHGIENINSVWITHSHFDHVGGIDDLRIFCFLENKPIHCLLSEVTYEEIKKRFFYLFEKRKETGNQTVRFEYQVLKSGRGEINFHGVYLKYFSYFQGDMQVTGFRVADLAYVTDIKRYEETLFEDLQGIKTLIISGVKHYPSHLHFSLEESLIFAERTKAEKVYLHHIDHAIDHEATNAALPKGVELAYDGLEIIF